MNTKTQTIQEFIRKRGVTMQSVHAGFNPNIDNDDWSASAIHWTCTLRYKAKEMQVPFSQGSAHTMPPTCEEVLSCLASDHLHHGETFEDWCLNLGYDSDSRKALRIYEACQLQTKKLKNLLGKRLLEELLECEQL